VNPWLSRRCPGTQASLARNEWPAAIAAPIVGEDSIGIRFAWRAFEAAIRRSASSSVPLTLMTARATRLMHAMLDRGFTTVRDTGGADWGLKTAVDQGIIAGPRLFIAGQAIGPTGGHSDARRRTDFSPRCHCCNASSFTLRVSDGVSEVRKAAREQIRQGADHVKIMMSGGVASPYDPLDSLQFCPSEVAAAVEEAHAFGRYVCAHAYTPEAIRRAANAGVRTIEHGNLTDPASAKLMVAKGMYLIANLVTYYAMRERAAEFGMTGDMLAKNKLVIDGGLRSLEICERAGGSSSLRNRPPGRVTGRPKPRIHHPQ
jgi:imidazolonepropionase-like amidohydrolase